MSQHVSGAPAAAAPDLSLLRTARLYAVVDVDYAAAAGWQPQALTAAFLAGGARLLQLRAKGLPAGELFALAQETVAATRAAGALLIVNDRADIAALCGADGVHVGQEDLSPADVRLVAADLAVVGLSTHSEAQVRAGLATSASYLAIGPVYATGTKATGYGGLGESGVRRAAALTAPASRPLTAIGGITLDTAPRVIAGGADSVAVISDLLTGGNPERRVREYLAALR